MHQPHQRTQQGAMESGPLFAEWALVALRNQADSVALPAPAIPRLPAVPTC